MTMTMADIATVTPELEAACRKLIEGVQIGGPYLPQGYNRLRLQFPGNHGGVNWGGTSFNPQLGYLFVNTNELGQLAGLNDRDPNDDRSGAGRRRRQPRPSGRSVRGRARRRTLQGQRDEHDVPAAAVGTADGGQREHRRVRVARAARRHRQPAARQAEHRPAGQRRHRSPPPAGSCSSARPTTRGSARSTRRPARSCGRSSSAAPRNATPSTYLGKDGKQYVVIASTGGGFFDAPLTDDSIMAFALPASK